MNQTNLHCSNQIQNKNIIIDIVYEIIQYIPESQFNELKTINKDYYVIFSNIIQNKTRLYLDKLKSSEFIKPKLYKDLVFFNNLNYFILNHIKNIYSFTQNNHIFDKYIWKKLHNDLRLNVYFKKITLQLNNLNKYVDNLEKTMLSVSVSVSI